MKSWSVLLTFTCFNLISVFVVCLFSLFRHWKAFFIETYRGNCDSELLTCFLFDLDSRTKTVSAVSPHPPGEPVEVRLDNNPGLWLEDAAKHWPPSGPPRSIRGLRTGYWSWHGHVTRSWLLASVEAALVWRPSPTLDRCTLGWQRVFSSTCRPSS